MDALFIREDAASGLGIILKGATQVFKLIAPAGSINIGSFHLRSTASSVNITAGDLKISVEGDILSMDLGSSLSANYKPGKGITVFFKQDTSMLWQNPLKAQLNTAEINMSELSAKVIKSATVEAPLVTLRAAEVFIKDCKTLGINAATAAIKASQIVLSGETTSVSGSQGVDISATMGSVGVTGGLGVSVSAMPMAMPALPGVVQVVAPVGVALAAPLLQLGMIPATMVQIGGPGAVNPVVKFAELNTLLTTLVGILSTFATVAATDPVATVTATAAGVLAGALPSVTSSIPTVASVTTTVVA